MSGIQVKKQAGFTIIELLIATLVFSVVLVVITVGIIQIAHVYYKGVIEGNTQSAARSILDTVSQGIQFSGGDVTGAAGSVTPGNSYSFCVGNQQYSYTLGYQVEDSPNSAKYQSYHALVQNNLAGCIGSAAQNVRAATVNGREMIGSHMRLSNIIVTPIAGTSNYRVLVRVVYGDDDLLYSPSAPTSPTGSTRPDAVCAVVRVGSQFCAVAELNTVVQKRVQ
jgi:prepilin-type N-terminal cleavage/methylation domain-containing protein